MMATPETGLIGIVVLLLLLLLGVPIGGALGLVGLGGLTLILGFEPALFKAGDLVLETLTRYELGTLPLFMLMAHLCFSSDASRDLFDAAARWIGHRRGGLALASVAGCAGFGAINGSSLATAATIGLVAIPEMRRHGYSDALATGSVCAGGTLGILIPPSVLLIVYGATAGVSVVQLYAGAFFPGIMLASLYIGYVIIVAKLKPSLAPPLSAEDRRVPLPAFAEIVSDTISHKALPGLIGAIKGKR